MVIIIACIYIILFINLQKFVYSKYWNKGLDVKISYESTECIAGEHNVLTEVITNNKRLPIPMLHVKFDTPRTFKFENEENSSVTDNYYRDDVFSVMGHQIVTRHLNFTCEKRGCFYMHDTNITASDLFLQSIFTDKRSNTRVIHVFPKKVDTVFFDIPFNTITGSFATQSNLLEDPFEFRGIREYQPYDGVKNINWKSSARNNELQVNTFFMTSSQEIHILLNLDTHVYSRDERLVESIISLASSLAERFITTGIPVALDTNAVDTYTKEQVKRGSGSGMNHMVAIDTALARIDTAGKMSDFAEVLHNNFEDGNDNVYYIVISNNRSDDLLDIYKDAKERGISSYYIVPELKTYEVEKTAKDLVKWDIEY